MTNAPRIMSKEMPARPNDEPAPSKEEVDKYISHLEQRFIADPSGEFGAVNAESQSSGESPIIIYEKARLKAKAIVDALDPDLSVSVDEVIVEPEVEGQQEYRTRVLRFSHCTRPELGWTMEIAEDDDYIQHQLEAVVRKIYRRRLRR